MIDGDTHRQGLRDIFGLDGYFLEIRRPRHAHRHHQADQQYNRRKR